MIYAERIRQARELAGLTQGTLAAKVGVTQSAIAHFETGRALPSREVLEAIGEYTDVTPDFFEREPLEDVPLGSLAFRARTSMRAAERDQAHQYARLLIEHTRIMAEKLNLPPVILPKAGYDPITAARFTRLTLGLGAEEPVPNLVWMLERNGVLVFALPIILERVDAFSSWTQIAGDRPFIALSSGKPGDRLRFSAAHETGHIVLRHGVQKHSVEAEHEANQFAAELLLPEGAMRKALSPSLSLVIAARLKVRWGVSMQMLIRRAKNLGIITERRYRYLSEQIGFRGWRMKEPSNLDIAVERPRAFRKMAELLYGEYTAEENFGTTMGVAPRKSRAILREYVAVGTMQKPKVDLAGTEECRYPEGREHTS